MLVYTAKRIVLAILVALTISMLVFSLLYLSGDPATALAGESATSADIEKIRHAIFTIEFKFKGNQDHPFLNKIKPCALSTFGVNYSPDGAYMTYADGSPVAYQLDLSFQELEPVYDIDYDSGEGTEGMGF